jgi:hypothetical protein
MSLTLQWLIVAPLVACAAVMALWRLMTSRLRVRFLSGLLQVLPVAEGGVTGRCRARVSRRIAAETAGGCAACSKR